MRNYIVGGAIASIQLIAASEHEKRLNRIIRLLEIANEELRYPHLEAHKRDMMGEESNSGY